MRGSFTLVAGLLVGCMSVTGSNPSHHDFTADRRYFVVQDPHADTHLWVQKALAAKGLTATTGDAVDKPADADVVVTTSSVSHWDMSTYVLRLDVELRDPRTNRVLASGESYHPSLQREDPVKMAGEAIDKAMARGS